MPGENGIEFLERVRGEYPDLPFILFTGKGSEEIASEAISAGVTDYLQKGSDTSQYELLANRIANAVEQYHTRRALEERTRRLELAIQQTRSGVWEYDVETGLVTRYEGASNLWGEDAHTTVAVKEAIAERVHPEDREAVWNALEATVSGGDSFYVEFRNGTPDGYRWTEARGRLVRHGEGDPGRLIAFTTDITDRKQRERELRETTARLTALFDHSPDMINVHDPEGNIIDPNPQLCEATGYDETELTDMKVWELDRALDPDDAHALWEEMETGDRHRLERRYERRDGSTFPVEVHIRRLDLEGEVRFVAISRDITERKERETELELYETMLETVPDGVYALDDDLRLLAVNRGLADMLGYSREELVGSHLSLINTEEGVEAAQRNREQLLDEDGSVDDAIRVLEHDLVTADGEEISGEARFRALPPDEHGSFRGTAGVVRDISERVETEAQLREERNRLSALFDDAPRPMLRSEISTDGHHIIDVNSAFEATFGYDRAEIVGRDVSDVLVPTENAIRHERLRERAAAGESCAIEVERITADGTRTFLLDVVPYGTESRPVDGTFAIYTDITEQKEYEQELERQNERLEEFASTVSHDLRSPLNVAEGRLELAREACDSAHLDDAAAALDRMDALIEDLLTVAREGEAVEEPETVDLAAVVEACWGTVDTADATLVVDTEATIRADRGRLQQLLENLVRNAVEHGGTDVTITVGALDGGRGFYVADDGPGIPADEREQVFESGYSNTEAGTGFGLAIVEEIATAHGWNVDVTDSADGGARVEITGVESKTRVGG